MKGKPDPEELAFKVASLARLERLSGEGTIDLFYGDECGVSLSPCVPYGWQFQDEKVTLPSTSGGATNTFALLSRDNRCFFRLTEGKVTARLVSDWLDQFSQTLARETVVVLDNAPVHQGEVKKRREAWEAKGLYVFFLPVYSPHLNLVETLWRKLKYEWLRGEDYADKKTLCHAVWQALATVGDALKIAFSPFQAK